MAARSKKPKQQVVIVKPNIRAIEVTVKSLSPVMTHQFGAKQRKKMLATQMQEPATSKREPRNPEQDYEEAFYRLPDGRPAIPGAAFRLAAVSACRYVDGLPMTVARGLFFIEEELVAIEGTPVMDERTARNDNGGADIRFRPRWDKWSATFTIRYNAGATTAEQILNLLALAGEMIGVGEYRVERGGSYGRFKVA